MTPSGSGRLRGLSPIHETLGNGMSLTIKQTRKTPAVALHLAIKAGSTRDPATMPGAMHLLMRLIDRGTRSRSASQIAEELDGRGVSLTASASRHLCSLRCTCLTEDFEPILELLGHLLMEPVFPESEFVKRRHEVMTAIRQDQDSPAARAVETLMTLLYGGDHPYGRPLKGTIDSLENLTRETLVGLHEQCFAPTVLSVVIVGDVDPSGVTRLATRLFGRWDAQAVPGPKLGTVEPASVRRQMVISMMNKAQTDIAYGFTAVRRSDPMYYACLLMNNVLGEYAMGGRLGDSIRERQGMAYYVSSALDAGLIEGPIVIRAGVAAANVERTIASVDEELSRLRRDGVTDRELDESRQYLIGSMPRTLETNAGIAAFLQTALFFELGLDYDERVPELLNAVSLADVDFVAGRLLDPARATVVIAGPYPEMASR